MKKVVHATSVHTPMDSRIFYRQCGWLAQNGYQVIYIVPADFKQKTRRRVLLSGVKKPGSRFGRPLTWLRILKQIVQFKPDILHFHDPELLVIVPVVRLFFGRKVAIVYDVHEYLVEAIQDKFWIPEKLRNITARLVHFFESVLGGFVDGQVFVAKEQARYYRTWNTRKIVLHNYPDVNNFQLALKGVRKKKRFCLVHIGSLYERRGIMTMLTAMDILVQKGYNPLLILGGVFESDNFQKKVAAFVHEHNLQDHVQISGWIDYTTIKAYLEKADAGWLAHHPSLQHSRESICTKQLEAMLAGLPVVVSDIPMLTRFVKDRECGLAVSARDPQEHAAAIRFLMDHPEQASAMGRKGETLVREQYTWQKEAHHLEKFYTALGSGLQF